PSLPIRSTRFEGDRRRHRGVGGIARIGGDQEDGDRHGVSPFCTGTTNSNADATVEPQNLARAEGREAALRASLPAVRNRPRRHSTSLRHLLIYRRFSEEEGRTGWPTQHHSKQI